MGVATLQGKIPLLTNIGGPFFWNFPMCIVLWGSQGIIVYLNHSFTDRSEWGVVILQGKIPLLTNIGGPFFGIFPCALFCGARKELLFI